MAALTSVSLASAGHQFPLPDHGYGASASRGVPVLRPSSRWYSLRLSTERWPG